MLGKLRWIASITHAFKNRFSLNLVTPLYKYAGKFHQVTSSEQLLVIEQPDSIAISLNRHNQCLFY